VDVAELREEINMKRILKVIGIGVAMGLALLVVQQALHIPEEIFMRYYWIFAVAVVAAAVLFNHFYHRHFQKKMKTAALFLQQGKPREYIQAVEELRQKAKGRHLQNLFTLNLSAGYCDLKEYKKAIELLKSLENARLYHAFKLVYHINLCVCYFYDGQTEKAMALYQRSQKLFASPLSVKLYGGNVAVLDVFALIEQGEFDQAKELLATAREKWSDSRLQADFEYLEEKLSDESN